jgi:hypothetical protein
MNDKLNDLLNNPDRFLFHLDDEQAYFVQMNRSAFYRTIFCDSRIKPLSRTIQPVNLEQLILAFEARENPQPEISYIFHMAHVGSTLLARGLDIPGKNVVYREPQVLRQLGVVAANKQGRQDVSTRWKQLLKLTTHLLSKSYGETQKVFVKANVPVNFLIPQLMDSHPDSPAILLYSTLENYLLALHKSDSHRQWVSRIIEELAGGWEHIAGISERERESLTLPQAIACIWLVQISIYQQMANRYPAVRTLDSEILFSRPRPTLAAAFSLFGQHITEDRLESIVKGETFNRHSKNPDVAYDNEQRLADRENLRNTVTRELTEARSWADTNIHRFNLQEKPPNAILPELSSLLSPG